MRDNAFAIETWIQFPSSFKCWEVPVSIGCGCTFASDAGYCYCLDRMDDILHSLHTLHPRCSRLFAVPLMKSRWTSSRLQATLVYEHCVRNRYSLLVPYNNYEWMYHGDDEYKAAFSKSPPCLERLDLPAVVLLPCRDSTKVWATSNQEGASAVGDFHNGVHGHAWCIRV